MTTTTQNHFTVCTSLVENFTALLELRQFIVVPLVLFSVRMHSHYIKNYLPQRSINSNKHFSVSKQTHSPTKAKPKQKPEAKQGGKPKHFGSRLTDIILK